MNQTFSTLKVSSGNTQLLSEVCLKINSKAVPWPTSATICSCTPRQGQGNVPERSILSWWRFPSPEEGGHREDPTHPSTSLHPTGLSWPWDKPQAPSTTHLSTVLPWNWTGIIHPCGASLGSRLCLQPQRPWSWMGTSHPGVQTLPVNCPSDGPAGVCRTNPSSSSSTPAHRMAGKAAQDSAFSICILFFSPKSKISTLY